MAPLRANARRSRLALVVFALLALATPPAASAVTVEPAMAGSNEIHLAFAADTGGPPDLAEVNVAASLESVGIGPLRYSAEEAAPGEWVVRDAQLAIPGDWQLRIEARRGEFDLLTETETVSVSITEES